MTRPTVEQWAFHLAESTALRSRDPSTQVGAVILRPDNSLVSVGYNGFPRGCDDSADIYADRPRKYLRTVHAEVNAILTGGFECRGGTLYVAPLHPCASCAGIIIQAGIRRVKYRQRVERTDWEAQFSEAMKMFMEAGVEVERC